MPIKNGTISLNASRFWLVFGSLFVIAAFSLLIAAFVIENLSCDRWQILRFIYPIFAGISAVAFLGSIVIDGSVKTIAIAASGGFAVYVASFVFIDVPDRCQGIQLTNFQRFSPHNSDPSRAPGRRTIVKLDPTHQPIEIKNPEDFSMFIGFVIGNFYIGPGGVVSIKYSVVGRKDNNTDAWKVSGTLSSVSSWESFDIPKSITPLKFKELMGIKRPAFEIPLGLVIECASQDELNQWNGDIEISVEDGNGTSQKWKHNIDLIRDVTAATGSNQPNKSTLERQECSAERGEKCVNTKCAATN